MDQVIFFKTFSDEKKTQKTTPINDISYLSANFIVDGTSYSLEVIKDGIIQKKGEKANYLELNFAKQYGNLNIKLAVAPIYFIGTFEDLIPKIEQSTGLKISRSPAVDVVAGSSNKYFAIVSIGEATDKNGNLVVDKFNSRIIIVCEDKINEFVDFYVNDVYIKSGPPIFNLQKGVTSIKEQENKKENNLELLLVYPNPAKKDQAINFEYIMPQRGKYFIELYDQRGNKVFTITEDYATEKNQEGSFTLCPIEGLVGGVYFIVLKDSKGNIFSNQKLLLTQ